MISGVHHAGFTVSDMDRSIAFYRDVLGLRVIYDSGQDGIRIKGPVTDNLTGCPGTEVRIAAIAAGEGVIELLQYTPAGKPRRDNMTSDIGNGHIGIRTDDIQELYHKLLANGTRLHCEPQDVGSGWAMYFRDPDGIVLEAIEGKLRFDK